MIEHFVQSWFWVTTCIDIADKQITNPVSKENIVKVR